MNLQLHTAMVEFHCMQRNKLHGGLKAKETYEVKHRKFRVYMVDCKIEIFSSGGRREIYYQLLYMHTLIKVLCKYYVLYYVPHYAKPKRSCIVFLCDRT